MNTSEIRFTQPARRFEEAIPVGAGRFGAMVYGAPDCELLRLNEDSVWSGSARQRINPDAKEGFPRVRALVMQGKIAEAEALAFRVMQGCPPDSRHYMPLGDLSLRISLPQGEITAYRRALDLETGICSVQYMAGGVRFSREIIASYPAQCLLIRLTADAPFDAEASLGGRDDYYDRNEVTAFDGRRFLEYDGGMGIRFSAAFSADIECTRSGNLLCVRGVRAVTFAFAVRTDYYHPSADCAALARADLVRALSADWETLRAAHIRDYRALYARVSLTLPGADLLPEMPADTLLSQAKAGDENALNALLSLYFRFGRYLMIAGSRPGSLPLNLQGIWNTDLWPAWGSRFTLNINTQMNYWPAESCALPECHMPLFALLSRIAENGRRTAAEMYGARGFCCHHNTDLWGDTAPQDLWMPATLWPTGGAWLALHIAEHYRYTKDLKFLREYYPVLRDAALFLTDYLTADASGRLVTCPSVSPENTYRLKNGGQGCLCAGPSMDSQIAAELFSAVIEAESALAVPDGLTGTLQTLLPRLPQPQIGQYGQIMEWAEDYDETEPGHRHISQLFALHPAHRITPLRTPELCRAASATLRRRLTHGGGHTGWSCAWIANLYARLHDGENAYAALCQLMQHSTEANLFDMHPPFQIDGNFGGTAAIAECLLQSDADGITLLPACPPQWHTGAFSGLRAYGGITVGCAWSGGRITETEIRSAFGGSLRIRFGSGYAPEALRTDTEQKNSIRKEADGSFTVETVCGGICRLTVQE